VISLARGHSLVDNARLFALANIAQADAGIVAWDAKYVYDLWRPIAAIREAGTDSNPLTEADPDWVPLGAPGGGEIPDFTPPFPAYTSGHATFGAAVLKTAAHFFGTDEIHFTIGSDELPGVYRSYGTLSDAAAENARSRIYLGIHWNFDDTFGRSTGEHVADYVFETLMLPR
jgi:membrane-associated phospholipid phosphatase